MNSRARVEGLAFVERILPLSWEQRQGMWAQMLVGGSHLAALFFFSGKEETRPELRAMLREEVTECWQKEKKQCELHLLFYGFITITLA